MKKSLEEIARFLKGELKGDGQITVTDIQSLENAGPEHISFAVKPSMAEAVKMSHACAFILPKTWPHPIEKPHILVEDPYVAFAKLAEEFARVEFHALGISPDAIIGSGCSIAEQVSIFPRVVIGDNVTIEASVTIHPGCIIGSNCYIGKGSILHSNVTIYDAARIGNRVAIHSGTVIGSDGFGYAWDGKRHIKIPQRGLVIIEDDVEIGANCTIDRATFGETRIGAGTKIDNLVQIGHNVTIGPNSIIVAQVGIAGSSSIGAGAVLGGQVGISGHITVGDGVKIAAQSGVSKNISAGQTVIGSPALPYREWLKQQSRIKNLALITREIKTLKEEISRLKRKEGLENE